MTLFITLFAILGVAGAAPAAAAARPTIDEDARAAGYETATFALG